MQSLLVLLFVLAISAVSGQDELFTGSCPSNIQTMQAFDVKKFAGHWYEIKRYYNQEETFCVDADYQWNDSSQQYLANIVDKRSSSTRSYIPSIKKNSDDGKFTYNFNKTIRPHWIIDTDYEKYAVIWSCIDESPNNKQGLWVLARSRSDSDVYNLALVQNALAPFTKGKLQDVSQETCGAYLAIPSMFALITMVLSKMM